MLYILIFFCLREITQMIFNYFIFSISAQTTLEPQTSTFIKSTAELENTGKSDFNINIKRFSKIDFYQENKIIHYKNWIYHLSFIILQIQLRHK